ncbi:uncharacterized protein C8A04DRAFT_34236 [Dichotomopilus funicola]|uniref:HNH nuclease domain-containing protein n=1 Tax=Dichotomopilus funicola TaxID=1934379 RepID=A0AAN6VCG0_9PEZI|nr:hypothetical protein C8A04DRAFT_34236 [Dichotomopilus funicola]
MEQLKVRLGRLDLEVLDSIVTATVVDPDAVRRFADDISPPAEPVNDYITEVDTRRDLFEKYRAICHSQEDQPNAVVFALFMVAPVTEIRTFLDDLGNPTSVATLDEPETPVPPVSETRYGFEKSVNKRDGGVCVFSGMPDPQAAHIVPFALSSNQAFFSLDNMLTTFWGPNQARTWRRTYECIEMAQSPVNGISMNHQIHFWFNTARVALKPLRLDEEGITVQWHWLKKSGDDPDTFAPRKSGVRIQTGQTFLFPRSSAMPSWDQLELQWDLHRVAALCGAADVPEDYYDYEDPYDREYCEVVAARERAVWAKYESRKKGKEFGGRGILATGFSSIREKWGGGCVVR